MKLKLVLKKQWFDMILSGEKKEEYRDVKEFYIPRFLELNKPLMIFNISTITGLFCYHWGRDGGRHSGLDVLIGFPEVSWRKYDSVVFYLGYAKDRLSFEIELKGIIHAKGDESWGAEKDKEYFVLKLGERIY